MKKYIITLSTLLCATALHGAASQQNGPSGTGLLSFAKEIIFTSFYNPEKGDQACNSIEEFSKQMKLIAPHEDFKLTYQKMGNNLQEGLKHCSIRKTTNSSVDSLHKSTSALSTKRDNFFVELNEKFKKKFELLQSMQQASKICEKIHALDALGKKHIFFKDHNSTIKRCQALKTGSAYIEQKTQNEHAINDEIRLLFIQETKTLVQTFQTDI